MSDDLRNVYRTLILYKFTFGMTFFFISLLLIDIGIKGLLGILIGSKIGYHIPHIISGTVSIIAAVGFLIFIKKYKVKNTAKKHEQ